MPMATRMRFGSHIARAGGRRPSEAQVSPAGQQHVVTDQDRERQREAAAASRAPQGLGERNPDEREGEAREGNGELLVDLDEGLRGGADPTRAAVRAAAKSSGSVRARIPFSVVTRVPEGLTASPARSRRCESLRVVR